MQNVYPSPTVVMMALRQGNRILGTNESTPSGYGQG